MADPMDSVNPKLAHRSFNMLKCQDKPLNKHHCCFLIPFKAEFCRTVLIEASVSCSACHFVLFRSTHTTPAVGALFCKGNTGVDVTTADVGCFQPLNEIREDPGKKSPDEGSKTVSDG